LTGKGLSLSFFNARAPLEWIVYVVDRRAGFGEATAITLSADPGEALAAGGVPGVPPVGALSIASPLAFRNLTQWDPLGARSRRENLVIDSALGNPARVGVESQRELSGFLVTIEIERRALTTLTKSLLPLLMMTFILFASLYFPVGLVKEKITVAITGALSGAVLLSAINSQLGVVGYTIAVEYVFYIFFALTLLAIISVLTAERLRVAHQGDAAALTERWTRIVFLVAIAGTLAGALWLYWGR
jgi:hypothetical protein